MFSSREDGATTSGPSLPPDSPEMTVAAGASNGNGHGPGKPPADTDSLGVTGCNAFSKAHPDDGSFQATSPGKGVTACYSSENEESGGERAGRASYVPQPPAPYPHWDPGDAPDMWEDTADATMYRTMRRHAAELLVAATQEDARLLCLDARSGTWIGAEPPLTPAPLHRFIAETEREWGRFGLDHFMVSAIDKPTHARVVKWAKRMANPSCRSLAIPAAGRVWDAWKDSPTRPPELTHCDPTDINRDGRYLGFPNGVVDLATGRLLPSQEGRRHLVSRRCADDYAPEVQDDRVDALLSHLETFVEQFLWDAAGYALWGDPSRRIYILRGPHNAGKSTWQGLMQAALGDVKAGGYGMALQPKALLQDTFGNASAHQENQMGLQDGRIAVASEIPGGGKTVLDTGFLKSMDGVAVLSLRGQSKSQGPGRPATASLFLSINDSDAPKVSYSDPALVDRLVIVDFPDLEVELSGTYARSLFADPRARQAMMARLVKEAGKFRAGRTPPVLPESVREATETEAAEALGGLKTWFLRHIRLVEGASEVYAEPGDIWEAAGADLGMDGKGRIRGFSRSTGMALMRRAFFPDGPHHFPRQKTFRDGDRVFRAYPGVRILRAEEGQR